MKITRVVFYLFALLLALVAFAFAPSIPQTHAASSGSTTKFRFHGLTVVAVFDSVSPDGCIDTFANVDGTQSGTSSEAFVSIGQFNNCTGETLLFASGATSNAEFQVSNTLASASLQATIPVSDESGNPLFDVSVNTTWTATGPIMRQNQSVHFHTKGLIDNLHLNAALRDATASGTVSIGTTNFTPEPPTFALIASVNYGEVTIMHS